jgi:hypothetical protein
MSLQASTRVKDFTGQLLDPDDFRDEQAYHRGRHQRLSRLAVGSGVLCGLEVTATAEGHVLVEPGIAIDPLGREIVLVDARVLADPFQPTDEDGRPRGARVDEGPSRPWPIASPPSRGRSPPRGGRPKPRPTGRSAAVRGLQ